MLGRSQQGVCRRSLTCFVYTANFITAWKANDIIYTLTVINVQLKHSWGKGKTKATNPKLLRTGNIPICELPNLSRALCSSGRDSASSPEHLKLWSWGSQHQSPWEWWQAGRENPLLSVRPSETPSPRRMWGNAGERQGPGHDSKPSCEAIISEPSVLV